VNDQTLTAHPEWGPSLSKPVLSDAAGGVEGARIEGRSFDTPFRQAQRMMGC
jgi:hypothetical protein